MRDGKAARAISSVVGLARSGSRDSAPAAMTVCPAHGEVEAAQIPSTVQDRVESDPGLEGFGCSTCVAEAVAAVSVEMAREEERKKREAREAKKAIVQEAMDADRALAGAVTEFEKFSDPVLVKNLEQRAAWAEKKLEKVEEELQRAADKRAEVVGRIKEIAEELETARSRQVGLTERFSAAFDQTEVAWGRVPRVKRDKKRDKALRARARRLLGLDRRDRQDGG